jgi:predicted MPP superfamily phosphohydrolase
MLLFLVVATTLWTLINAYAGLRLVRPSSLTGWKRGGAWALVGLSTLFVPAVEFLLHGPFPVLPGFRSAEWAGFALMGFTSILFPAVLLRDILWGFAFVFRLHPRDPGARARAFNRTSAVTAGLALTMGLAALVGGALPPRIKTVDLAVRGLPPSLEGFSIALISDLHVGGVSTRSLVEETVKRTNALSPDLVVLAGDLTDGSVASLRDEVAPLAGLKVRSGKLFVTGNHDYFRDFNGWLAEVRKLGFTVLTNEHRVFRRGRGVAVIAGIPDYQMAGMFDPKRPPEPATALRGAPRADVRILLSHSPAAAPEAGALGYDYQLSGHSHGGQFYPWKFVVDAIPWFKPGFHEAGRMRLYVSQGTGTWGPPMRLGTRREIVFFRLVREKAPTS